MKNIKKNLILFNFLCILSIFSVAYSEDALLCEDVQKAGPVHSPSFSKNRNATIRKGSTFVIKVLHSFQKTKRLANKMCEKAQGKATFFEHAFPDYAESIEKSKNDSLLEKLGGREIFVVNWDASYCFTTDEAKWTDFLVPGGNLAKGCEGVEDLRGL